MKAQIWNNSWWLTITDAKALRDYFNALLPQAGFGVISFQEHQFTPQGYSALWLLAESHLAIHTFPEEGCSYVELSSCIEHYFREFCTAVQTELHDRIK